MTLFALILICTIPGMAKKINGNGTIVTKPITVGDYSVISLGNAVIGYNNSWFNFFNSGNDASYDFNYKQGDAASLQVTIDENLYPYLVAKTNGGELTISTKEGVELVPTRLKLDGTSKGLKKIHTSGNIDFVLQSSLTGEDLIVITSKGSDITMKQPVQMKSCTISAQEGGDIEFNNLTCETIDCSATSGSDVSLKGKANMGQYKASSGSDIHAGSFVVTRLECSASSGSDISTHVTEYIDASASSGAEISYKGNPKAKTSTSLGGDITKEGH